MSQVRTEIILTIAFLLSNPCVAQLRGDKSFLEKASQDNLLELELGKLTLKKTNSPEMKSLATTVIQDHETLARDTKPFLDKAGVQEPTSLDKKQQELFNRLNGLSGDDFNKEYVKAIDKEHAVVLREFKRELGSTHDSDLQKLVASTEKVIEQHAQMIRDMSRKMGLQPPGQTERSAGRIIR